MILQHLITFSRVVETGGFSRAGELVGLSQPAVTRQVAALEAELGAQLLDRSSRQFRLTPAGEVVYERARRLALGVAELREAVGDLVHPDRGRVTIGAVTTVGLGVLPPILTEFARQYPMIRVLVKMGRTSDTVERVLEGEIDMAVVTTPVTHNRLLTLPLTRDPVVLVCSPERRGTLPDPLPVAYLSEVDMIAFQAPSRFRTFVDGVFEQAGVHPNYTMEFDSHEAVKLMVQAGFGIAMLPKSAVQADLDSGRLQQVSVAGLPELARTTSLLVRRDASGLHPSAERLMNMILAHFGVTL